MEELRRREGGESIPVIVITAKDLTAADHERLNGYVEGVLEKGTYDSEALLREICARVKSHAQSQ